MSGTLDSRAVRVPPPCGIPPIIYAEYLPKLEKISILVQLPTPSEWKTKVIVGKDGQTLHVFHEGINTTMLLPVPAGMRDEHLALGYRNRNPINPGHITLSWRIPPSKAVLAAHPNHAAAAASDPFRIPWSAADLVPALDVVCRNCHALLVTKDNISEWKDLPSENWAEMMEFWHCHKPTDHKENVAPAPDASAELREQTKTCDHQLASRAYGANSIITAQSGVGFVDLTKFLFYGEHCRGLSMTALPAGQGDTKKAIRGGMLATSCLECSTQIGHFEFRKSGFSLYKWAVNLVNGPVDVKPRMAPPNLAQCISAALLEIQARDNSAKVVLQGDDKEAITIWVLNPHIIFSCLAVQSAKAIKVLFRNEAMAEAAGELELPDAVVSEILASLTRSNDFLPPAEKTTTAGPNQDTWSVGLLQRL